MCVVGRSFALGGAYRRMISKAGDLTWSIVHSDTLDQDLILSDEDKLNGVTLPEPSRGFFYFQCIFLLLPCRICVTTALYLNWKYSIFLYFDLYPLNCQSHSYTIFWLQTVVINIGRVGGFCEIKINCDSNIFRLIYYHHRGNISRCYTLVIARLVLTYIT